MKIILIDNNGIPMMLKPHKDNFILAVLNPDGETAEAQVRGTGEFVQAVVDSLNKELMKHDPILRMLDEFINAISGEKTEDKIQ